MRCRLMKYIPHDYQTRWHKENDKEVMPVKFIPHEYQQKAIDRIVNNKRFGLFLEMGLG